MEGHGIRSDVAIHVPHCFSVRGSMDCILAPLPRLLHFPPWIDVSLSGPFSCFLHGFPPLHYRVAVFLLACWVLSETLSCRNISGSFITFMICR